MNFLMGTVEIPSILWVLMILMILFQAVVINRIARR